MSHKFIGTASGGPKAGKILRANAPRLNIPSHEPIGTEDGTGLRCAGDPIYGVAGFYLWEARDNTPGTWTWFDHPMTIEEVIGSEGRS